MASVETKQGGDGDDVKNQKGQDQGIGAANIERVVFALRNNDERESFSVDELPEGVTVLNLGYKSLEALPEHLPASLTEICLLYTSDAADE